MGESRAIIMSATPSGRMEKSSDDHPMVFGQCEENRYARRWQSKAKRRRFLTINHARWPAFILLGVIEAGGGGWSRRLGPEGNRDKSKPLALFSDSLTTDRRNGDDAASTEPWQGKNLQGDTGCMTTFRSCGLLLVGSDVETGMKGDGCAASRTLFPPSPFCFPSQSCLLRATGRGVCLLQQLVGNARHRKHTMMRKGRSPMHRVKACDMSFWTVMTIASRCG